MNDESFNPLVTTSSEKKPVDRISSKEGTDLDYARNTYIDLIEKNRESIDIMLE